MRPESAQINSYPDFEKAPLQLAKRLGVDWGKCQDSPDPADKPSVIVSVKANDDILYDLRKSTARLHRSLESRLSDLTSPNLDRSRYQQILRHLLAFYRPVESALFSVAGLGNAIDRLEKRQKSALIELDLARLESAVPVTELPSSYKPEITSTTRALGALYVFEGATLGGQVISKHLKDRLGIDDSTGAAFFNAYGYRALEFWRSTQRALVDGASSPAAAADIIHGAYAVFSCMDAWVDSLPTGSGWSSREVSASGRRFTQLT